VTPVRVAHAFTGAVDVWPVSRSVHTGAVWLRDPIVMLSSTIRELATLRQQVGDWVEQAQAATAWRFEEHAVAAGTTPDEQYLSIASTCDLYVLIVADQLSPATEAEYERAYKDNPAKVLPFFLGSGSAAVADFRALIDGRHTRVQKGSMAELVDPVTRAILESIATGSVVRPLLIADIDRRIERARTAIADVPMVLEPRIVAGGTEFPAAEIIGLQRRVALTGIGGSGKTTTVAIAARRAANDRQVLPIYVTPANATIDPPELIRQRLEAVRFRASDELLDRWGTEGRVMLAIDGVEGLTAICRRRLMTAVARWAERFPRCGVVISARRFSDLELPDFARVEAAPLGDHQMRDLMEAFGAAGRHVRFSDQVRDIGRWPMWATALIVYGTEATTGLQLLQRLVDARLETAGMSSAVEASELRAAARFVARDQWPVTVSSVPAMLDRLHRWHDESPSAKSFGPTPPDDVLSRLGEAALLEVGDDVDFPHRLLATILAAEQAVVEPDADLAIDDELAPFVAALCDDDAHVDLLHGVLAAHPIFVLARYLRLSPPCDRRIDLDADVQRLAEASRRWSSTSENLDVAVGDAWIAWRPADTFRADRFGDDGYRHWRSLSDQPIEFWATSPFSEHTPEFVAAISVLGRFRSQVLALDPNGDPWRAIDANRLRAEMSNSQRLANTVVEALESRRRAHLELLDALGLADATALRPPDGEPHVTIWVPEQGEPLAHVSWGSEPATVNVLPARPAPVPGTTELLARLLGGQPLAVAYEELKRDIEAELGCRLGAQTWSRPDLVPAWAW
jgi:hypothetical protein